MEMGAAGFAPMAFPLPPVDLAFAPLRNLETPKGRYYIYYEHDDLDVTASIRIGPGVGAAKTIAYIIILTTSMIVDPFNQDIIISLSYNGINSSTLVEDNERPAVVTHNDPVADIDVYCKYILDDDRGPVLTVSISPGESWVGPERIYNRSITLLGPTVLAPAGGYIKLYRQNVLV